jgi:hypothetical protein
MESNGKQNVVPMLYHHKKSSTAAALTIVPRAGLEPARPLLTTGF